MSAFAFGGVPARVLRSVLFTSEVCVSADLLAEYGAVPDALRVHHKVNAEQWQSLVAGIAAFVVEARVVQPTRSMRVCRDPKDDMVLECCRAARASFLITGDRDLLSLDVSGIGAHPVPNPAGMRGRNGPQIVVRTAVVLRAHRRGSAIIFSPGMSLKSFGLEVRSLRLR